ncbi:MAG: hypothetical protein ABW321_18025, partial [Polyangiales bacterium]
MSGDQTPPEFCALRDALDGIGDPRVLTLIALAADQGCRQALQAWLSQQPSAALTPDWTLTLAEGLAQHGWWLEAWQLTQQPTAASDPRVAAQRARWAMRLGRYEDAIAAADVAIAGLLHPGLTVADLVRLSARGASLESIVRYEHAAVVRYRHLHEPLAIRWEALRRLDRKTDAAALRHLCLTQFPKRASVWATAGNHALDDGELERAAGYFARCLALDPDWTPALAGLAIVHERQKVWAAALPLRKRVVDVERALEQRDAKGLQRVMRYAAALGRVGRWAEAGVLFRRV